VEKIKTVQKIGTGDEGVFFNSIINTSNNNQKTCEMGGL
jgi:hypothetical protein